MSDTNIKRIAAMNGEIDDTNEDMPSPCMIPEEATAEEWAMLMDEIVDENGNIRSEYYARMMQGNPITEDEAREIIHRRKQGK